MTPEKTQGSTAAIIASYRPAAALTATVQALASQVDNIVVVDDGSPDSSNGVLIALEEAGAVVHRLPTNQGIGAALNAGISHALGKWNPDFLITLDQDSVLVNNYVKLALNTYFTASSAGINVGFICASSYSGHDSPHWKKHLGFTEAFDPMQSGFVIPRSTLDQVGSLAADFFIDGVDTEFTMRCRQAGLAAIIGPGCTIEHDLGERGKATLFGHKVKIAGRELSFNYHSPSRVYYICRNGTVISKRYISRYPAWVARRLLEESKAHTLRFVFSPNRVTLLEAATSGFCDAMRGRMGRIPTKLEERLK